MCISHMIPAYAETNEGDPNEESLLTIESLDPSSLGVEKLGIVDVDDEEELTFDFNSDDIVRVSIVLDKPSTIDAGYSTKDIGKDKKAVSYRESLKQQQAEVNNRIEKNLSKRINVKWNLTLAVNIISAEVEYGDINKIRLISGVKDVIMENRYEAINNSTSEPNTSNTSGYIVGAVSAWADGYTGAGSRIAIIDTGLDTDHQSVNADAFDYAISQLEKKPVLMKASDITGLDLNGNGKYVSTKIPYAYNYVDNNSTNINHLNDTQGEHGSHVAGIAAANRYIKSGNSYVEAISSVKAVGMAPDAQLLVMKVFGNSGGAYDSDYMAAIEDAILLGCDSANLSLGSAVQGFTFSDAYQSILNKLNSAENNKMVVVISAGNSYGLTQFMDTDLYIDDVGMHTGGSPGTFINSLCVAAAQNIGATGTPLKYNNKDLFYTDTGKTAMTTIAGSQSFIYIDAEGSASDFKTINSAASLNGKIVIINRGGSTFSEKANNAVNYSPKAVIVANNQAGSISMNLDDFTGNCPVVSIMKSDAEYIKANSTKKTTGGITYYSGTITVTDTLATGLLTDREDAEVTDFSSWGIPGSLIMKPEITAPGGDIYSIFGKNKTDSGTTGGSDQYEMMSGTSMAAPHVTGLAAVVAQYLRDSDALESNEELTSLYSIRAIIQSLLMSTATPMKNDGNYVSILQQGAGLAEVHDAVNASSVVMIGGHDNTLTAKTGSATDGKVKVEFGDDPERSGEYTYSFIIYNLTDHDLEYRLSTDVFTQDRYEYEDEIFMAETTTPLNVNENYIWESLTGTSNLHDVDKDGDTDQADAQALAEYLAGEIDGTNLDLTVAEMDGDGKLTSSDVYLLLNWVPDEEADMVNKVPAHGRRTVTVELKVRDSKLNNYPSGAYIEGFTKVECITSDAEGKSFAHTHTIPLLGFYGSWTDPSMFDNTSYIDTLYGTEKTPYTGVTDTNYVTLTYNGVNTKFAGNPYMVEASFPTDKLAVNSKSVFNNFKYSLIRAAGTTGFAISKIDDYNGNIIDVLQSSVLGANVDGIWFSQSQNAWQNLKARTYQSAVKVSEFNLNEGEKFRIGYYAVPEYNAMCVNADYSSENAGSLSSTGFRNLLLSNKLGKGAFIGYDFMVDNTEPVITQAALNGNNITVNATDNINLAYVAVMSLDGQTKYAEKAPGSSSYSITFDAKEAINNANGYVAVFAADYAGNEAAVAIKVNNNTLQEKTVYVLTDILTAGNDYLIVNRNTAGSGYALSHTGSSAAVSNVTVNSSDSSIRNPYIHSQDVDSSAVWNVTSGWYLKNENYYVSRSNLNALSMSTSTSRATWTWDGTNNRLTNNSRYLTYSGSSFSLSSSSSSVYLYVKTSVEVEAEPYVVSSVSITKDSVDLYKGNETDLTANVLPLTASDRSINWSSSNTSVATVDQNGHVKAVAAGKAVITAISNANAEVSASCTVNVTVIDKALNGIVWDEEGQVFFSGFNSNALPSWNKLHNNDQELQLHSAFMNTSSALYTGTLDSSFNTVLYSVNRTTYALTELGTNYVGAFDVARATTRYTDFYVFVFANYVIMGNLSPQTEDEGTFSGFPYGILDFNEKTGSDAYLCGIAAKSIGTSSTYYILDEEGKIWQTTMSIGTSSISFGSPTLVVDTGISTSFLYQSLYYDGTYIYWTHYTGTDTELIIIEPSNRTVYHAGNFGDGVWPVAGLYVNGSAAPASAEDEIMKSEKVSWKPLMTREQLMTEEVIVRLNSEFEKTGKPVLENEYTEILNESDNTETVEILSNEEESTEKNDIEVVNTITGSTNTVRSLNTETVHKLTRTNSNGGDTVSIVLSEKDRTTNGIIQVAYDLDKMSNPIVELSTAVTVKAYSINENDGTIKIVYATRNSLDPDEEIATITFNSPCEDNEVTVTTLERNTQISLDEEESISFEGEGHSWGEWVYDGAETKTHTHICTHDETHKETENCVFNEGTVEGIIRTYTCQVCGGIYTEHVKEGAVIIKSSALVLEGVIQIQFRTTVPDPENTKIVVHFEGETDKNSYEKTYLASEGIKKVVSGETEYYYKVPVYAKQMNDKVTIWFTDLEGNRVSFYKASGADVTESGFEYSVATYIDNKWDSENEKTRELVRAMKRYGAYAQLAFNYEINKANEIISSIGEVEEVDPSVLADHAYIVKGTAPEGISVAAFSLTLEDDIAINYRLNVSDENVLNECTFKINGKKVIPVLKDGQWYVRMTNITAKDMDNQYELSINRTGYTEEVIYKYGLMTYCYNKISSDATTPKETATKNLCKAIYWYSEAANQYFGQ